MENLLGKSVVALAFLFALMVSTQAVQAKGGKIVGTWNYSAPDAPYEYSKGEIIISENGDQLEGKVSIDGNEIKLNSVKFDKDVLSFSLYVEGGYVSVKLTVKKYKFTGTANTSEGELELSGEKKK